MYKSKQYFAQLALILPAYFSMKSRNTVEAMAAKKFDIILFGASGFTGKHCVKKLAEMWSDHPDLKWAVAGRSVEKLKGVLEWATERTGRDLEQVELISANVSDEASLNSMCEQGKLILNLVGPYRFYGFPVVEACIRNKCHHIDISGEIQFLEQLELDYHKKAKEAGVYIVEACGFDSIPSDMGVMFVKEKFPGVLNSVEGFMSTKSGPEGSKLNTGTLMSALHVIANYKEIKTIREKFNYAPLPECQPKLKAKRLFYSPLCEKWSMLLSGTDTSVVRRSQRYMYEQEKERPIQYEQYMTRRRLMSVIGFMFGMAMFGILSMFRFGRTLIAKYPGALTFGMFSPEGPSDAQIAASSFSFKFRGRGFSSSGAANTGKEDMEIITQVDGPEAGYVTTPIVMIQAGLTVLQEKDKLPDKGGVFTPATTFHKTSLIERCHKYGVKFSVVKPAYRV